jgi:hypothetical protein
VTWISDVYTRGFGYNTTLFGQEPLTRFVYGTAGWGIRELTTDGVVWHGSDLTTRAGGSAGGDWGHRRGEGAANGGAGVAGWPGRSGRR